MKFVDETKIFVKAGHGGDGCLSFRREANVERGGPDGGDGGRGGHIYVVGETGLSTLVDFRYQRHYKADRGGHGMGRNRTGAFGNDVVLKVPVGTEIMDGDQDFVIADVVHEGQKVLLARGGIAGLGNAHFKSSTNRAPRRTKPSEPGEEYWVWLKLKLLADVGLLGFPNAGKSTLLARVSAAKPKIADYPFTTKTPGLGVVDWRGKGFVMADIPGLIEGAHAGHGLGDKFLKHLERCRFLVHLVDVLEDDLDQRYLTIRAELKAFNAELAEKPEIICLNKCDALDAELVAEQSRVLESACGTTPIPISAASGAGIDALLDRISAGLFALSDDDSESTEAAWSPL